MPSAALQSEHHAQHSPCLSNTTTLTKAHTNTVPLYSTRDLIRSVLLSKEVSISPVLLVLHVL